MNFENEFLEYDVKKGYTVLDNDPIVSSFVDKKEDDIEKIYKLSHYSPFIEYGKCDEECGARVYSATSESCIYKYVIMILYPTISVVFIKDLPSAIGFINIIIPLFSSTSIAMSGYEFNREKPSK